MALSPPSSNMNRSSATSAHIALSAVCGFRPMLSTPIAWVSDTEVLYAAGPRTLVRLDTETKMQLVLTSDADVAAVTAFALASSKRALAVAEVTLSGLPIISVYEWSFVATDASANSATLPPWNAPPHIVRRRKRVMGGLDLGTGIVTSLTFSRDSKFLVVVSAAPAAHIFWIEWAVGANGRLAATSKDIFYPAPAAKVAQVDFALRDTGVVAVSGPALLKYFHFNEGGKSTGLEDSIKPEMLQLRRAAPVFTAHAWLPEGRFVAATATGALWLFARSELVATLAPPPAGALPIFSLLAAGTRGFFVGCEGGVLRLYEKSVDAREYYCAVKGFAVLPREQRLGPISAETASTASTDAVESIAAAAAASVVAIARARSRVCALALSPSEDTLSVVTAGGDSLVLNMTEIERATRAALSDGSIFKRIIASHGLWAGSMGPVIVGQSRAAQLALMAAGAPPLTEAIAGTALAPMAVSPANAASARPPPPTGILGLCVALSRPIAVTIGADRRLIVWTLVATGVGNSEADAVDDGSIVQCPGSGAHVFSQMPTPALSLTLTEAPVALALHPSGLTALVATDAAVHICSIMLDAIVISRSLPIKSVTNAAFSHFGALVALSSGNNITILHGVTLTPFTVLRGHVDRVAAVLWDRDDRSLVSAARDGDVRRWAVIVPNAVATGVVPVSAAASVVSSAVTVAEFLRAGDAPAAPDAHGLTPPLSLVGKVIAQVGIRDLFITALALGHGPHDFLVAGVPREGSGMGSYSTSASATTAIHQSRGVSFGTADSGSGSSGSAAAAAAAAALMPTGPQLRVIDLTPATALGVTAAASSSSSNSAASMTALPTIYALDVPVLALAVATFGGPMSRTRVAFAALGHVPAIYKRKPSDVLTDRPITSDPAGAIRALRLPLTPSPHARGTLQPPIPSPLSFDSVCGHGGPVTAICSMPGDDSILVSGGADGSLAVWHVSAGALLSAAASKAPQVNTSGGAALVLGGPNMPWPHDSMSRPGPPPPERGSWLAYADEVLVQAATLHKSAAETADYAGRVGNVEAAQRFAERQREREYVAQLEAVEAKYAAELDAAKAMTVAVAAMGEKSAQRLSDESLEAASKRYTALEELRESYAQKLERESARCAAVTIERDRLIAETSKAATEWDLAHGISLAAVKAKSEVDLAERAKLHAAAVARLAALEVSALVSSRAAEDDLDAELEESRFGFEARVAAEAAAGGTLKGEHAFLQHKAAAASAALAASVLELEGEKMKDNQLAANHMSLTKDISVLRKEISERDARIGEKEMQMLDLRKKIQELEKFK